MFEVLILKKKKKKSVLISLISDTSPIWGLHIKRIFGLGS